MFVAAKSYALISGSVIICEYALFCDMRLITREYGIFTWRNLSGMVFAEIINAAYAEEIHWRRKQFYGAFWEGWKEL